MGALIMDITFLILIFVFIVYWSSDEPDHNNE